MQNSKNLTSIISATALITVASLSITAHAVEGPFIPANGKTLFIMGQDTISIDGYRNSVGIDPAGVVAYTDLSLGGTGSPVDNGAGPNHMSYLMEQYTNSVPVIALWAVGGLDSINSGNSDQQLRDLANYLESFDKPSFLRFGYEFDGSWNSYDPSAYINAWKRMHRIIREEGAADDIAMVWQSSSYCGGTYLGNDFKAWYPGDEFVDWIGLSYFTPQDCGQSEVNKLVNFARNVNKPLMIAESANQRYDNGELTYTTDAARGTNRQTKTGQQVWDEWYAPFFRFIRNNSDVIKAVTYINADWDSQSMWAPPYDQGYWGDTRVQQNSTLLNNWVAEMNSGDFIQASSSLANDLRSGTSTSNPPAPIVAPQPTIEPQPTAAPQPTTAPQPTATPQPTTPQPTTVPNNCPTTHPIFSSSCNQCFADENQMISARCSQ